MSREMKNSNVKWVGEIPQDWNITKLKLLINESNSGEVIDKSYWNSGQELLYSCSKNPIASNFQNFPDKKRTMEGDLLLTRNATPYVFAPEKDSIYTNVVQRIKLNSNVNPIYIKYILLRASDNIKGFGDIIESFNMEVWGDTYCTIPPLQKQQCIVTYLDKKVSVINNIITEITLSIEEYKRYKQSVITEAVTKGLNPNVEMKDSGIEWIGELPKDWSLRKINSVFNTIGSGTTPKTNAFQYYDGNYHWIQSGDINGSIINNTKKRVTGLALNNISTLKLYKPNFIVVAMYGASIANVSISNIEACVNQACCVLSEPTHNLKYAFYCIKASKDYFITLASGGTQPNISQETIKQIRIPIPFLQEQEQIARYLDKKCSDIDNIITQKQQLLTEIEAYKKSLIHECVTGKRELS